MSKDNLLEIEKYVIFQVREEREARNITQEELSNKLGKNSSYIAHIEAPSKKAKYNISILNEIAKIFDCSIKDFFPEKPI
ncbi:helix-turn-helix transcriptional regulator [Flavivirga aquimarina]|uniref:Helix-turn-helix transcriptional regulator n=2 Tax=Flavivirga TaxID=1209327 RepID=A0ABT8WEQ1_9FLAO|nr:MULTISPECIES: helix-turn-helix transcriptional regulator [Flavivirga]MDO5971596.1 helix-turn-helix transcriptional regulator [Flavivirga aquimarina]MDO5973858.1 helix-turn-helix transcriptional regulator [Flavivirga jejuensis]